MSQNCSEHRLFDHGIEILKIDGHFRIKINGKQLDPPFAESEFEAKQIAKAYILTHPEEFCPIQIARRSNGQP